MNTTITKTKKRKPSILDPFADDIKYYLELGVTIPNIMRIMNEKTPIKLSLTAYRHFIETRCIKDFNKNKFLSS